MNIYGAMLLFSFIILLYWVITELFTFFFRMTGLPAEKARFQVISLLTGCGFTTRESEIILSSRARRQLARVTMLFGYVFNLTIVSTLVNVFFSLTRSQVSHYLADVLVPLAEIVFITVLFRVPAVHRRFEALLEKLARKVARADAANSVMLIDYIGHESIAQVDLAAVPEFLRDVPLSETGLRSEHNILVMLVERGGEKAKPARGDTVFLPGDKLTVFGDYGEIRRVFDASERFEEQ